MTWKTTLHAPRYAATKRTRKGTVSARRIAVEQRTQLPVFFANPASIECHPATLLQFGQREWLGEIIAGTQFHGLDGGFDGCFTGEDNDFGFEIRLANSSEKFQAG